MPKFLYFARTSTFEGLLDLYTGATVAYSVRKLSSTYTGNCLRVRRSSDSSELDIGFNSNNELNTDAINTFIGAGDGFVTIWYDQSGNGYDVVQTTSTQQPLISTQNSKSSLNFDGSNDFMIYNSLAFSNGSFSIFSVQQHNSPTSSLTDGTTIFDSTNQQAFTGSNGVRWDNFSGNFRYGTNQNFVTEPFNSTNQSLRSGIATSTGKSINLNGTQVASNSINSTVNFTGVTQHKIGAFTNNSDQSDGANNLDGDIQELVVYNNDQSSNRSDIETNINTYFGVY